MTTRRSIFFLIASILCFYSCKKNKQNACKVVKYHITNSNFVPTTFIYTYSGDKVLRTEQISDLGPVTTNYKRVYQYEGDRISKITSFYNSIYVHDFVFTYNADNTVKTMKGYGDTALFRTDNYFYTNGKLTKIVSRNPDWFVNPGPAIEFDLVFNYTGNNITSSRYTLADDPAFYREYIYTYNSTPNNYFKDRYYYDYMVAQGEEEFMPMSISENLIASMKAYSTASVDTMNRVYSFTFRPDRLIDKVSYPTTNGPLNINIEATYEYDCK